MHDEEQIGFACRQGHLLYKHLVGEISCDEIEELHGRPENIRLIGELSDPVILRKLIEDLAAYDAVAAFRVVQERLRAKDF